MPISKKALLRYQVIDYCLVNKYRRYPNMDDLIDAVYERLQEDVSSETIQKDISKMKLLPPDGFDAPIKYNRGHHGYEYTDPKFTIKGLKLTSNDIESLKESIDLVQYLGGSRVSMNFTHAMEKVLTTYQEAFPKSDVRRQIVQTDSPPTSRGFEHFDFFFRACMDRIPVSIVHYSYTNHKFNTLVIHPVLLKEFDNHWYIVGYSEHHKMIRTFGLDRIFDPLYLQKSFQEANAVEQEEYFKDVYGVYPIKGEQKQKIIFRASPMATNYLQAHPIHESQNVVKKEYADSVATLELIPSVELVRLFRSYGRDILIIEPEWLTNAILQRRTGNEKR